MRLGLGISIPGTSGLVQAAFSPLDLSPVLWLDASDTSTITEVGGAVSQWDDKSGNGNHVTQGTAALQPTTGVTTIDSKNVVTFDADFLAVSLAVDVSEVTVFAAFDGSTTDLNLRVVSFAPSSGNDYNSTNGALVSTGAAGQIFDAVRYLVGADGRSQLSGTKPTTFDVYAGRFSSDGTCEAFSSGATASPSTSSASFGSSTQVLIGGRFVSGSSSGSLKGNIAEVIVFPSTLSNANLNAVGDYLADKWGKTWTSK